MTGRIKKIFELEPFNRRQTGSIEIIGQAPVGRPYVLIQFLNNEDVEISSGWVKDKDIELFARNILKSLNKKP